MVITQAHTAEGVNWRFLGLSEVPSWYTSIADRLGADRISAGPRRTYGLFDLAVVHGNTQYAATVGPAAIDYAVRGLARFGSRKSVPALEVEDVKALLVGALAEELSRCRSNSAWIVGPDLIGYHHESQTDLLMVYVSLASLLWRANWKSSSAVVVGGWMILGSDGSVKSAATYSSK